MKSSFCIDLQRFMLIPTKFPLSRPLLYELSYVGKIQKKRVIPQNDSLYVVPPGIEPGTQGFSVLCSTN